MKRSALVGLGLVIAIAASCSSKNEATTADGGIGSDGGIASCTDGIRDGAETGTDCGGTCPACDGAPCGAGINCASGVCTAGSCGPSAGKTCGVGLPNTCADGQPCQQATDCTSNDCGPNGTCIEPACKTNADCAGTCDTTTGTCLPPSATDGKQDNGETGIDCGGPNAPPCAVGQGCVGNGDCQLLACTNGTCVIPTSTDGIQNGGETDVDCGGKGVTDGTNTYQAPACKDGKKCLAGTDCVAAGCTTLGTCTSPSCGSASVYGTTTCGSGETGVAGAVHEDCCRSLPLPTLTTRRLDRYEITAGRMRSFLTSAGPDVRAWVASFIAANPTSQLATLANMAIVGPNAAQPNTVLNLYPSTDDPSVPLNLVAQLAFDLDNYSGIRGCDNSYGNYGANTYWQPETALTNYGIQARVTLQSDSDQKPQNCSMPMLFAAFCAWDGGTLATMAEILDAWGTLTYPWGATDIGRPNYNWCNGGEGNGGFTCQDTTDFTALSEAGVFYEWPSEINNTQIFANDVEEWIAAPGRMIHDATTKVSAGETWQDLFANLVEYTGDFVASTQDFCDFSEGPAAGVATCTRSLKTGTGTHYTNIPSTKLIGYSWEGHMYPRGNASTFPVTFQYGKFGGRCSRAVQ